jgi:hypothetical protein
MVTLKVHSGGGWEETYEVPPGLTRVGRATGNEVRLERPSVSAVHCELWLMRERLLVRDLASTNGTFIDGRPVQEGELREGSLLGVGEVELRVHGVPGRVAIPAPKEPPPPPPRVSSEGWPCCRNHWEVPAAYRCPRCGEQYCAECLQVLGRRGGKSHAYCPGCRVECVAVVPPRSGTGKPGGWLAKLTQTLRLRR